MPSDDRPPEALPSVCWFAPLQLLRTARQVAIATVFGRHADAHVIEAVTPAPEEALERRDERPLDDPNFARLVHDYTGETGPFWLDYVADTGDGWDATATVAYHLAQPRLLLGATSRSGAEETERGSLLILGGDQVYPVASFQAYEQRLLLPFRSALPPLGNEQEPKAGACQAGVSLRVRPDVYAVPGNHDWYDGLVAFTRLFCSKDSVAGWCAPQLRSYFALRLPGNWWLLGVDLQLGSDIDAQQEAFFEAVAESLGESDRVILCYAEPHWLFEATYPDDFAYRSVHRLERRFEGRIAVSISGDLHLYARHEAGDGRQRLVAGGGGAFLHLTTGLRDRLAPGAASNDPSAPSDLFERRCCYPSQARSVALGLSGPFVFHARNPSFGLATALLYMITAEALNPRRAGAEDLWSRVVSGLFTDAFALFWTTAFVVGIVFFTDTHRNWYRWTAGSVHALCHLAAAAILAEACSSLAEQWLPGSLWRFPAAALATAVGGYLFGPLILSLYLTVSLLVFRCHRDEASSAIRCPDYKNFLRLCIGRDGDLTIYPVAIDRVARRWMRPPEASGLRSRLVPVDGSAPRLIEEPIVIPPTGAATPAAWASAESPPAGPRGT